MEGLNIRFLFVLCCFCPVPITSCSAISGSCMRVYDQGGASAVLRSSECLQWNPATQTHVANAHNWHFSSIQEEERTKKIGFIVSFVKKRNNKSRVTLELWQFLAWHQSFYWIVCMLTPCLVLTRTVSTNPWRCWEMHCSKQLLRLIKNSPKLLWVTKSLQGLLQLSLFCSKIRSWLIGHVGDSRAFLCSEKERNNLSAEEFTIRRSQTRQRRWESQNWRVRWVCSNVLARWVIIFEQINVLIRTS